MLPFSSYCSSILLVVKGIAGSGGSLLSDVALVAVNTGSTIVVPNGAVSLTNSGHTSVAEFSALVVTERFGANVKAEEGVSLMCKAGDINVVTGY